MTAHGFAGGWDSGMMYADTRPGHAPPAGVYDVIAIGTSAGGVEALLQLIPALPATLAAAVVVVLHLAPHRESLLPGLLRRHAHIAVQQAAHGDKIAAGTVYLAPPDEHLLVAHGQLELSHARLVHFSRPSIDLLFESVAGECGPRAIGVILTGSGMDGARGVSAIKRTGGTTIVQDPSTAAQRGMPEAALATGCIDLVLPLDRIAAAIVQLVEEGLSDIQRRAP
jgi:two-component system chemotaxis response regulator CheB